MAFRRAIELDPNNPYASGYLSILLLQKGRTEESVRISHELALANPVAIDFRRVYAIALFRPVDTTRRLLNANASSSWIRTTSQPTKRMAAPWPRRDVFRKLRPPSIAVNWESIPASMRGCKHGKAMLPQRARC